MKQPPYASLSSAVAAPQQSQTANQDKPRRRLRSTAEILARGVSLDEVQKAVKQLRPEVHQVG
ncbi:MAG TPA: hypothetical protein VD969_18970 [Symbiobacteriaceae bacterium]|nr:hypothetical protein [Symbiobacteriaceae bacterium]